MKATLVLIAPALLAPLSTQAYEDKDTGSGTEPDDEVSPYGALTGADELQGRPSETARPGHEGTTGTQKKTSVEKGASD